jgi:hypothetical protein
LASVGFMPNGVELKAERRKPSGEQHCDIEDIPSLTGVLAHFRLHEFKAIRGKLDGRLIQSKGIYAGWLRNRIREAISRDRSPIG